MPAKKRTTPVKHAKTKKRADNSLFYTALIIFSVLLALFLYRKIFTPPTEIVFACGDYCPGPSEQYEVAVYKGVTNNLQCRLLGGRPQSVTGWTTVSICRAD